MLRTVLCFFLLACGSGSSPPKPVMPPTTAPPVTEPPAPAAPAVTAEQRFTGWLTAFNAADRAGLEAFRGQLAPDLAKEMPPVDGMLGFRDQVGGFELKKSVETTPTRFVAILKERDGDQFARCELEIEAAPPNRVTKLEIRPTPTPDELRMPRMTEAEALSALRAELDRRVAKDQFSGAVLVAKGGKPIFAQAYGMADRDKKVANTLATRFRIGSMNKMFTATATLQLEEGEDDVDGVAVRGQAVAGPLDRVHEGRR